MRGVLPSVAVLCAATHTGVLALSGQEALGVLARVEVVGVVGVARQQRRSGLDGRGGSRVEAHPLGVVAGVVEGRGAMARARARGVARGARRGGTLRRCRRD